MCRVACDVLVRFSTPCVRSRFVCGVVVSDVVSSGGGDLCRADATCGVWARTGRRCSGIVRNKSRHHTRTRASPSAPYVLLYTMHGMQAESEIFRGANCQAAAEEEEADYEEYQRKMRAAAKAKAPPVRSRKPPPPASNSVSTQELLEKEHAARVEARERLEDREQRLDEVVSKTLSGTNPGETSQPLSVEELRGELKANERAMQNEATEFVASYR